MRTKFGIALLFTLISTAAMAQERPVFTMDTDVQARTRVDVQLGEVQINTHNTRYHLVYLPVLPPLPGTAFRTTREIPNALLLTNTPLPQRPREGQRAVVTIR